jgi:hypothetical protein
MKNMAVTASEQDKMRDELAKWDPSWHARKFAELYNHFQGNLQKLYPECHLVEREKHATDGLVGAPQDVLDAFIQRWHKDLSVPSVSGVSMYDLAKKRNDAFFAECGVCQRVDLKTKLQAQDVHPSTRESIWLYFHKLNKFARFVALGEDTTSQIMSVVEQLTGNNMNLNELTQMLPMLLGDQVDSSKLTGLIESVGNSVQSTIGSAPDATPEALNASVANMMSDITNNPELMRQLQSAFNLPQ